MINAITRMCGIEQTQQPSAPSSRNTFLEKINPSEQKPMKHIPKMSTLRFRSEFTLSMIEETIKSVPRSTLMTFADTALFLGALCVPAGAGVHASKAISSAPSLLSVAQGALTTGAGVVSGFAGWGLGFFGLHHAPRKLQSFLPKFNFSTEDKPVECLTASKEKSDLNSCAQENILKVSEQISLTTQAPKHFIQDFTTEIVLGNWQVNHAFEQFNSQIAHQKKDEFAQLREDVSEALPLHLSMKLNQAIQSVDIAKINRFLPYLPDTLAARVVNLQDLRIIRNLTCFASRAIREQRTNPTEFESSYMNRWIENYKNLHPQGTLNLTPREVIALLRESMSKLGALKQVPLLNLRTNSVNLMSTTARAKKVEQRWMKDLNQEHEHHLHGIEHIPSHGRALLPMNHSLYTMDMPMGMQAIREQKNRDTSMLIDKALMALPTAGSTLQSMNYREGDRSKVIELLADERLVGVAPGGATEGQKPYSEANKLLWDKAIGFSLAHVVSGAPMVPLLSPQADQLRKNTISDFFHQLQKHTFGRLKVPMFPALLAPKERELVRVDHFAMPPFEAAPLPVNNLSKTDQRFKTHVSQVRDTIASRSQEFLYEKERAVKSDTSNGSYPMAWA